MARRKGPPQDSIDSILLAISRRDDIDADTLSHYFDRLDEEWTDGARDKVLHLLRTSDPSAHAAAVLILSELATDFDLEELEDFVADPTVNDLAKLTLSPVLKELGSEMADDGIIEYLNDPAAAMQQMQLRLLELVGQSEMGVESILEDVTAMPIERRLGFVDWLGSSNDPRAAHLLIPLLESQSTKVVTAVIDALEKLGSVALQQTMPALNYIVSNSSNRQLKQHARAALGRLTMQAVPGTEDEVMSGARLLQLPPFEARVSFIDGSGSQLIMLSWKRPDGLLKGVNVLYQDQWGIKDCYGIDEMEMARWVELVTDLDGKGFSSFKVSFEHGRALVLEARALNKRLRRKLPVAYSIWRPLIEGEELPVKKGPSTFKTMVELPELDAETLTLAQHGEELYQMPEFLSWMYEPIARVEPYMTRYWATYNIIFDVPGINASGKRGQSIRSAGTGGGGGGRKARAREKEQKILLDELVQEALGELIDEKWRTLYEARLRRQAAIFQYAERNEDATLIAAVAAMLHPTSDIPIKEQPFLRAMIRISIEQGPLRMMAETLGPEHFGPSTLMPFEPLDNDQQ